jgi:hypothetical protein
MHILSSLEVELGPIFLLEVHNFTNVSFGDQEL